MWKRRADPPPDYSVVGAETRYRVIRLVDQRKSIEAAKVIRDETQWSLKEIKVFIDGLRDGRIPPAPTASLADRVRALSDQAAATALVRAETGMTEGEARQFVTALE